MSAESETVEPVQQAHSSPSEKSIGVAHAEFAPASTANLVYSQDDEEPEIHVRTYVAVAAMFLLNMIQVFALQGPPAVVCSDCETDCMDGLS